MPDPSHAPTADCPGAALVEVVRSALPRDAVQADVDVRRLIDAQVRLYAESQAGRQAQSGIRPLQLTHPGGLMHKAALDVTGRRIPCPPGREAEMLALLASDLRAHVSVSVRHDAVAD